MVGVTYFSLILREREETKTQIFRTLSKYRIVNWEIRKTFNNSGGTLATISMNSSVGSQKAKPTQWDDIQFEVGEYIFVNSGFLRRPQKKLQNLLLDLTIT